MSPDGLADGEDELPEDDPLEPELGMLLEPEPLLLEPLLPEPLPELPEGLEPEPPLPLVWAAANAGVRAMVPTRRINTKFRMCPSTRDPVPLGLVVRVTTSDRLDTRPALQAKPGPSTWWLPNGDFHDRPQTSAQK